MGLLSRFIKSKIKGFTGELKTDILLLSLDNSRYKVINNFMTEINGRSCQIDHLIISPYGLFVIETKNYSGWIFAGENNDYWTQIHYKMRNKFYNPIKQNNGHINVLKHFLIKFSKIIYIPIVVFSSAAKIKTEVPSNVVHYHDLISKIKSYKNRTITEPELKEIYELLVEINHKHNHDNRYHASKVKQNLKKIETSINSGFCPRCGGKLVTRKGRFGNFYGCSNFPKCRYTHK
ncbi:MAG: NERD domain-containing protein [Bacteroidetes Order II. Incertae sedis bacterium]|nr:NERD domain-containing protein [Bacteroidetes Order II. bacterium]